MSIELSELSDSAQKAFPAGELAPARDGSWQLIAEMGWLLLELPEDLGGLGLGREAAATIHLELARVLPTAPLAPALLGLQAVSASETLEDKQSWIGRITAGEYMPLAMLPSSLHRGPDGKVSGSLEGVFEGDMATHVVAGAPGIYALISVDAPGVALVEQPVWDKTRRLFALEITDCSLDPALILAEGQAAQDLHDRLAVDAQFAVSADCLGGAEALLEMTIDYLKTRRQFGRPLAMFQALKHRVAGLKVRLTAADALFWNTATKGDISPLQAGSAKAHIVSVYLDIAEEAIQLHGGIGLTEEHPCHLFFKRAFLNCQLCGNFDYWEEQAGRDLLATA